MIDWEGNKKESINSLIEGEPVKITRTDSNTSYIFIGMPFEYFESTNILMYTENCCFGVVKCILN